LKKNKDKVYFMNL